MRGLGVITAALVLVLGCANVTKPSQTVAPGLSFVDVFSRGSSGVPGYRIPAVVATSNGTILAFAEQRHPESPEQHDDHAKNDIVLRRSADGGKTWAPLQLVADSGDDSLNDPCAVYLPSSRRVLLMYQRFPKGFHARKMPHTDVAQPGYGGPRNTQTFLIYSNDDGATWSAPRDITRSIRSEDAISVGSPGVGIVLTRGERAGRILMPLYEVIPQGDEEERFWRNRVAYSDDHGETWRLGERVPLERLKGFGNECQLAQCADGSIRMHARLQFGANCLARSISRDNGITWAPFEEEPALVTTPCMTSLVSYTPARTNDVWLLASLPSSSKQRENGTVFVSRDGGGTWTDGRTIFAGGFAYSCLVVLPYGRIGCLYERGPYNHISFAVFDLTEH